MAIIDFFNKNFRPHLNIKESDFFVLEYAPNFFVGTNSEGNIVIVQVSESQEPALCKKTKYISLEQNVRVEFQNEKLKNAEKVNIIKCTSTENNDRKIFLELSELLFENESKSFLEIFDILHQLFSDKKEISDSELIGFYAEFFTLFYFDKSLNIKKFWQSKDRMKYDFSFSETEKLEVKATAKNQRVHHFRHEQLFSKDIEIFVLSYMLRFDDEGLSLFDLLEECKKLKPVSPKIIQREFYILKNCDEERLKRLKFNTEFTKQNMRFYKASDIPKFNQLMPDGVSNAEYDCSLENIQTVDKNDFVSYIKQFIRV